MTIYHADRASPEVLARVQAALAPVCAALGGAGLHRLASDLPPKGWRFEMRRESVRPAGVPAGFVAGQGWPVRVVCLLRRLAAAGRYSLASKSAEAQGPRIWTEPGWSLAGLVVLVADLGPDAAGNGLWPALEAVSSAVLVGGYVGRLS